MLVLLMLMFVIVSIEIFLLGVDVVSEECLVIVFESFSFIALSKMKRDEFIVECVVCGFDVMGFVVEFCF